MKRKGLLLGLVVCLVFGLASVSFGANITLDWPDNVEVDLAGYNAYRSVPITGARVITTFTDAYSVEFSSWTKVNGELITDSIYVDETAPDDTDLMYYVTAVDLNGNESGPSNSTTWIIPLDKVPPAPPVAPTVKVVVTVQ